MGKAGTSMLLAHPAVLRELVTRYESLSAAQGPAAGPELQRRLDDVSYTLCVTTGTRQVEHALAAARARLAVAAPAPVPATAAFRTAPTAAVFAAGA
ncbi:DUF5133 domain-containing protein [Streptomyces sp. NPDC050856]|uniref:DUF5133 domain-containing protein n=1 Tax=Streptomyces sp. NPDC050856 TaxID=3154939 RepID=UPI0033D1C940